MAKGAVVAAVVVGAGVLIAGAAFAFAGPSVSTRPVAAGPPPPPPPSLAGDLYGVGSTVVTLGGRALDKANVTLTGGHLDAKTVALDVATGGLYTNVSAAKNWLSKIF